MNAPPTRSLAFASVMLVLLTIVFETVLGVVVDHKSIPQLIEHYAIWRGELWPIVLAFLACTPFLQFPAGRGRGSAVGGRMLFRRM